MPLDIKTGDILDIDSPDVAVTQNIGDRPLGSTEEAELELKCQLRECLNAYASEFHE